MTSLAEFFDRISGVHSIRDRMYLYEKTVDNMQRMLLEHQRDISELKGTLKALVKIHSSQSH